MWFRTLTFCSGATAFFLTTLGLAEIRDGYYFPPPGQSISIQNRQTPEHVGLENKIISMLRKATNGRWALWRHGYLVHVEGDFNEVSEVKSLRKTWHALTVGAAIKQGRIPSYSQKLSAWAPELKGHHANATWWHVITQTSGFDYPYAGYPAYKPGEIWTYSDKNPKYLCTALARVFGIEDYQAGYEDVLRQSFFDVIGMRGWSVGVKADGIRLLLDLEDMGRLGLLVLARGCWDGQEIIEKKFVEQLERKQTDEIPVNYDGPNDGRIDLNTQRFPDAPYGFMTWVNTDTDFYPAADSGWAWGAGAGGHYVLWNHKFGIVFAGVGIDTSPSSDSVPHIIERSVTSPNPLFNQEMQDGIRLLKSDSPQPAAAPQRSKTLGHLGEFSKWASIEIVLPGPASNSASTPNPFSLLVDVAFEGPGGKKITVPAFYDGDGRGKQEGSIWKVRFSAEEEGPWSFSSSSFNPRLHGYSGSFLVTKNFPDTQGFYRWGRLEAIGTAQNNIRYLKFRDGPFWLKAGCDDPENFLGSAGHFNTMEERIAAINYLASKGVNSLYIMTHNLEGDDNDVWPWLGSTSAMAKTNGGSDARFDIPKLHEWRQLFEYMQHAGVVPYIVLEDDSAWSGYDHGRYYREIVARFGDLPALLFNLGEEHDENYSLAEALAFMQQLTHIDPYRHPRGIHNVNHPSAQYIDAPQIDFTSIQTKPETPFTHNELTTKWLDQCKARQRRPLMVGIDEGRPEEERPEWWESYLAGGVWEIHVKPPYDRPLSNWDTCWTQLGGTRAFMESVPFWRMEQHNQLVKSGQAFCLAHPSEVYAFYLPKGGEIVVDLPSGFKYLAGWWNPANGADGTFEGQVVLKGGRQTLQAPGEGDWALRIERQ